MRLFLSDLPEVIFILLSEYINYTTLVSLYSIDKKFAHTMKTIENQTWKNIFLYSRVPIITRYRNCYNFEWENSSNRISIIWESKDRKTYKGVFKMAYNIMQYHKQKNQKP